MPGAAYYLRTGWDLSDTQQRNRCFAELVDLKPELVVGSPSCRWPSSMQAISEARVDPVNREQMINED